VGLDLGGMLAARVPGAPGVLQGKAAAAAGTNHLWVAAARGALVPWALLLKRGQQLQQLWQQQQQPPCHGRRLPARQQQQQQQVRQQRQKRLLLLLLLLLRVSEVLCRGTTGG